MDPLPNPYQPPQTPLTPPPLPGRVRLASPWLRLAAVILDGLVAMPLEYLASLLPGMPPYFTMDENPPPHEAQMVLLSSTVSFVLFVALHFVFLKNGQTIGKRLLKLQMQDRTTGTVLPVAALVLKRYVPLYVLACAITLTAFAGMPILGLTIAGFAVADVLCIFRRNHYTLHDDIAHTRVVQLLS